MFGSARIKGISLAIGALLLIATTSAHASGPPSGSPSWYARSLFLHAASMQRALDQAQNIDYQLRFLPLLADYLAQKDKGSERVNTDPYLLDYASSGRASVIAVSYPNRYGATIRGHLWVPKVPFTDPVTHEISRGPFPGVLFVNGLGTPETAYWAIAQGLVEHGYVVMTFDPQGAGVSDLSPKPTSTYCDQNGAWRAPQELGVREQGPCAGELPAAPPPDPTKQPFEAALTPTFGPTNGAGGGLAYYADNVTRGVDWNGVDASYGPRRPPFVFGAFDAIGWLLSDANPGRSFVDGTRIGVIGHSMGADAALNVGNGDPLHRFKAVVTFDTTARMLSTVSATVPTMIQASDHEVELGPFLQSPDQTNVPVSRDTQRFNGTGVDHMTIVIGSSGHLNWGYEPDGLVNPFDLPVGTSSRNGQRVGLYYALSWFDRYLKGATTSFVRGDEPTQQSDATRRLLASSFDGSVDASSIATGRWDPATQRNVSYAISGLTAAGQLSAYFPSSYSVGGHDCLDILAGCN